MNSCSGKTVLWDMSPPSSRSAGFPNKVSIPCPSNSSLNLLARRAASSTSLDSVTILCARYWWWDTVGTWPCRPTAISGDTNGSPGAEPRAQVTGHTDCHRREEHICAELTEGEDSLELKAVTCRPVAPFCKDSTRVGALAGIDIQHCFLPLQNLNSTEK